MGLAECSQSPFYLIFNVSIISLITLVGVIAVHCYDTLFYFFQMQMSIFYTSFLVLVSLSTWKLSCEATELNKPTNLPKLCAETFLYYWNSCCDHQCGVNAYKRTLGLKGEKQIRVYFPEVIAGNFEKNPKGTRILFYGLGPNTF